MDLLRLQVSFALLVFAISVNGLKTADHSTVKKIGDLRRGSYSFIPGM